MLFGAALLVITVGYASYLDLKRQQYLIDKGFCTLVFTEDDGDENYICDDGTRFERDYD